jgi:hypothetical protein
MRACVCTRVTASMSMHHGALKSAPADKNAGASMWYVVSVNAGAHTACRSPHWCCLNRRPRWTSSTAPPAWG